MSKRAYVPEFLFAIGVYFSLRSDLYEFASA